MAAQVRRLAALIVAMLATVGLAVIVAAAPANATSTPRCKGALLKYGHSRGQGAAGHGFVTVRFRNISQSTCSLRGYPGLDALKKNGHVLKHAKRSLHGMGGAHKVKTIVLDPNQVASAVVEWLNFNGGTGGDCKFSHSIAVTAPNTSRTEHFTFSVSKCGLKVHPVVHGRTGQP